jgi:Bacteriocin-protection, YdeI or OmpD-Associated/Domain of unknown function (DUF1905)
VRFTTTLDSAGKNAAGFRVPREVVEALGKGKRPPVVVTINGYSYRNTVAVYGDEYLIGVAMEHRGPAGVKPGDVIEVDLELDSARREVEVPKDFAEALVGAPEAKAAFEALSYSNKRRLTLSIEDAKSPETRQRRIEKSVAQLREGQT